MVLWWCGLWCEAVVVFDDVVLCWCETVLVFDDVVL